MRVLVTGAHGFVGSHLTERLLRDGHAVRAVARRGSDLSKIAGLPVEVVEGDLCSPETLPAAVEGVDAVVHLAAALKGFREEDLRRVNEGGTKNLVDAARPHAARLARFVVVSSLAAAGPSPGGRAPRTDDMPEQPLTWYGRTKLAGERAVLAAPELRSVVLRPAIVFGPRDRDVYGYFRIVKRGLMPLLAGGDRYYSLVYVKDLVDAIAAALAAPIDRVAPGTIYSIADDAPVSWGELGERIAAALGVRAHRLPLPEPAAVVAGTCADAFARLRGRPEIFSAQKVIEMRAPAWVCDPSRAHAELGWTAATPLADALGETARWYREHGWL